MLWKGFQRPKRLEYKPGTLTPTYGQFFAQPFERGFSIELQQNYMMPSRDQNGPELNLSH